MEAWLDGKPWAPRTVGANAYNDVPPILKLGLYREPGIPGASSVTFD